MKKDRISIIWNVTRLCNWNCNFCCVNATYTRSKEKVNQNCDENYKHGNELSHIEKLKIIDQLDSDSYRIDFSGGEVLIDDLNIDLIIYASEKLGKENWNGNSFLNNFFKGVFSELHWSQIA